MRCKRIQELLKSAYLDGEVSQGEQLYVKEHLAQCSPCRRLEKELQEQHRLFQKAKQHPVPERVWQNIRDTIITERLPQESGVGLRIPQWLRELWAPRPVFALASVLTVVVFVAIFAGVIIRKGQYASKYNGSEAIAEYRLNLESEDLFYTLGTNIEEYFL
jgi:predicted anti-sigma-YlaC factor YlaD